ncbi:MAG: hypothetical protein IJ935_19165 [Afipia sp.]|nr:hypothetical protein [Afipia sp.]
MLHGLVSRSDPSEPDHWSSNPVNGEYPLPSICPMGSKFRVKANFLLADQLALRTMVSNKTPAFPAKMCCPGRHFSSGEHNAADENGEEKRWQ